MRRSIGVVTHIRLPVIRREVFFCHLTIIIFMSIAKFILHLIKKYCIINLVSND